MALSFFPRVIKFFELFRQQNDLLGDSARLLHELFDTRTDMAGNCREIVARELAGNAVATEIARALALTFITPIDREDIYAIATAQENALNAIRAISTRIGLYQFDSILPGARDLVRLLHEMHLEIARMIDALKTREAVDSTVKNVRALKVEADSLLLVALGEVYERHPETPAAVADMIKWSHIYDRIEDAIALTELLANIVEGVSLKHA